MTAEPRKPVIEVMDNAMVEILRRKTPAERLAITFGMWESAREMLTNLIRAEHQHWTEQDVAAEVARRLSHAPR